MDSKALLQFVHTLCKLESIPLDKVEKLMRLFPQVKGNEAQFGTPKFSTQIVNSRSQDIVEAGGYLVVSTGKFVDKILPLFLNYLAVLPLIKLVEDETRNNAVKFVQMLISQLGMIANKIHDCKEEIVQKVFEFYQTIETNNILCLVQGALQAIGLQPFPFAQDHIDVLLKHFEAKMNERTDDKAVVKVLVLNAMKQCSFLPTCTPDQAEQFFKLAQQFMDQKRTVNAAEKNTFAAAIELITACGLNVGSLLSPVTDYLQNHFTEYFDNKEATFSPSVIEEYKATLHGLSQVVARSPAKASGMVDFIVDELLKASSTSSTTTQYTVLRDAAVECLGAILKTQMTADNDLSLVNSVFTTLYTPFYLAHKKYVKQLGQVQGSRITDVETIGRKSPFTSSKENRPSVEVAFEEDEKGKASADKYKQNEALLSNIIIIIGKIVRYLNDQRVTDLILLRLLGRIHYPPQSVDVLIIEQLTEICVLGQESAYNAIIVEFMNIFKRILKDTETRNITNTAMPNALLSLATNLPASQRSIRENLAKRVQKLFCQLGKDITPDQRTMNSPLIQGMGYLLPILAELAKGHDKSAILDTDPESEGAKLSRSVWYYCVLFKFVERLAWRTDWFDCTVALGSHMPVLTAKKMYYFKQMQMEVEGLLQNGFNEKDFVQNTKTLIELLPGQANNIKNLTYDQVLYILSIYHMETLRARSGTFQPVFAYLEDPGIANSEHLSDCCKAIADKAFPGFMDFLKNHPSKEKREEALEAETQVLMIKYCSRSIGARRVADKSIVAIAEAYPQITWNRNCLQTLLDLVETIGKACNDLLRGTVRLPNSDFKVELPDDLKDRQALLKDLVELCNMYISFGIRAAPEQTHTILQEYMYNFRQLSMGFLHHIGFSLAMDISSNAQQPREVQKGKVVLPTLPSCVTSVASKFVNTLELKAHYSGEVSGIIDFLSGFQDDEKSNGLNKMEQLLLQKFQTLIVAIRQGKQIDTKEFNTTVYRSVAFIVAQQKKKYLELIHMICWVPALLFTTEALQTGTSAWTWLLASRPDLHLEIMVEICEAWCWTIHQRIGLFSDAEREASPVAIAKPVNPASKNLKKYTDAPHRLWIDFLQERFIVVRESSTDELDIICKMLQTALTDASSISILPVSMCTRFRLLLLALRFMQSGSLKDEMLENLLRERVYLAALYWFCHEQTWYDPGERSTLVDDVQMLIDFCKSMVAEDGYQKKKKDEATTFYDGWNELDDQKPQEIYLSRDLSQVRKLIILLVGNEIDHIIAWTNPQNRLNLQIPEETKFSTAKIANWKDFITTAWDISPRLCIHMSSRFPGSKTLRRVLEKKVKQHPTYVLDVPEAVDFLVTEENVRENIPQLKYLLYWANITPNIAVEMLHKKYNSHPIVTQYAVRVLRSFAPETIIYYIPQLVQALRYDKTGLLFDYLVGASQESELIAHQLIWNTQTYTETKNALSDIAQKLRDHIIERFDKDVRMRYIEEFEFFESVTKLSGLLKEQASTREQRKPLLKSELQKLIPLVKPGPLYLPTNPDTKVHGIDPDSSTPLQSAAKVPIMVAFQCHTRDDEVDIEDPEIKDRRLVSWKRTFRQACIFKVGDDVRQDMLAVQIIELFKRIFDHVGLELFLYPYKVIATKPGCGLIEVVPNSISRDQLGKKVEGGLVEYFQQRYGPPNSEAYQLARKNFIKSMAAYSVVTYILQIKDRHNGNILVDEDGHLVHIDFGFMLESSPGKDMGFEKAPFKLSEEMINIMGGRPDAEPFKYFMEQTVKAFLAARQYADTIVTLFELMLETDLPCFKVGAMEHLAQRLSADKSDKAAAKFFTQQIIQSCSNIGSFTTYLYDVFQHVSQGIDY